MVTTKFLLIYRIIN